MTKREERLLDLPERGVDAVRRYVAMRTAKPLSNLGAVHTIHAGTDYAAEVTLSDLKEMLAAYDALSPGSSEWGTPKHPGDAVRIVRFERGDEIGDVRIQHYQDGTVKVASFLPGRDVFNLGDTPKVEPESFHWITGSEARIRKEADAKFDEFVARAKRDCWIVSR